MQVIASTQKILHGKGVDSGFPIFPVDTIKHLKFEIPQMWTRTSVCEINQQFY